WKKGDKIVVTTTDYLPRHSEELEIEEVLSDNKTIMTKQTVDFTHNGDQYPLSGVPSRLGLDFKSAETRAAVALLSRSIRIISGGKDYGNDFPNDSYIGGHTIVRQGFLKYQVQGVEFHQLGQGGRRGHDPINFYGARKTPPDTFVKDSSINESMTRWITLRGTHNVTLQRNVGWKSIGHGFYLEDGTEIENNLYSNIGIFARAAVFNDQNPRNVPGILASPDDLVDDNGITILGGENVPFHSDYDHPTVFRIMNGWNEFVGNMAAGAGTCGACYWLARGATSGEPRNQKWTSSASMQVPLEEKNTAPPTPLGDAVGRAATTPLKKFRNNYCTTAMNSFNTVDNTSACIGVNKEDASKGFVHLQAVPNPLTPKSCLQGNPKQKPPNDKKYVPNACILHPDADAYYPKVQGLRKPTLCTGTDTDCSTALICNSDPEGLSAPKAEANCTVTTLDRYTSSFHWTETNFAAIWLRPQWYLMVNSVLTDVQNGGVTFVTGGGYTTSDVIHGHWALARKSV